jgi:16S rRNA (guanine966-N2)-methyltransferase
LGRRAPRKAIRPLSASELRVVGPELRRGSDRLRVCRRPVSLDIGSFAGNSECVIAAGKEVMRVIAGRFKGRMLLCPPGLRVRPTADPIRETVFNILGSRVSGLIALDLFAGVGTLGIEALSRGALEIHFVERNRTALRYLRGNLETLGITEEAEVFAGDAFRLMKRLHVQGRRYRLVLCDPPYGQGMVDKVLELESRFPIVDDGGTLVIQHHVKEPIRSLDKRHVLETQRTQGDTTLSILAVA